MRKAITNTITALSLTLLLSACTATGENYRADVYKSSQVNKMQEVKTVEIISVLPARVEVSNAEAKQRSQIGAGLIGAVAGGVIGSNTGKNSGNNTIIGGALGGAAGAAAGSMVSDNVLVEGVSLTYRYEGKAYNSAQVGSVCEYKLGAAILVSQTENETRIQPNTTCDD